MPPRLSILIPTLVSRTESFARISTVLEAQITTQATPGEVEIVSLADAGEMTIGEKRNRLMARATGTYTVSVDDDDMVTGDYLGGLLSALRTAPEVDCLSLWGRMFFPTGESQPFHYALQYGAYRTTGGVMTRPPHHLNPIRREIALRFPFEHVRAHEDSDVALRMVRAKALRSERPIDGEIYHYFSRRNYHWHRVLEATEFLRHPLAMERRNVLRIKRRLRGTFAPKQD